VRVWVHIGFGFGLVWFGRMDGGGCDGVLMVWKAEEWFGMVIVMFTWTIK
jgi:hypothetical protein